MMPSFKLFQQWVPIRLGVRDENGDELHEANLMPCGTIEAPNGEAALDQARQLTRFSQRSKSSLMRWPIVEEVAPLFPPDFSYSPPLETICTSCGGKHVGSCPMNACKE